MAKDQENKYVFDFNRITYQELMELDISDDAESPENQQKNLELIAQSLVSWPFDDEISVQAISALGLSDYAELQGEFNTELKALFRRARGTE